MSDYIGTKDKDGAVTWPRFALNGRPARTSYTMRQIDATRFVLVPPGMAAALVEQKINELAKVERQTVNEDIDGERDTGNMDAGSAGEYTRKRKRGG